MSRPTALILALASGFLLGCGADSGSSACVPGLVAACACPGGGQGVQTCAANGAQFGACTGCPSVDAEAPGDVAEDPEETASGDLPGSDGLDVSPGTDDTSHEAPSDIVAAVPCEPCGYGTVKGVICAPNEQIFIAAGRVTIDAIDCDGSSKILETTSAADGSWTLEGVPCGLHTVVVKAGSFEKTFPVQVETGETTDHSGVGKKQCFKANATPIAVLWGQWDHQHQLLDALGLEYDYYNFEYDYFNDVDPDTIPALTLLRTPAELAKYRIIFFNCGSAALSWATGYPEVAQNLREFVLDGGSLYASDLSWAYLEAAFPEAFDFYGADDLPNTPMANDGPQQAMSNVEIAATITDPTLAAYVGVKDFVAKYGPGPLIALEAVGPSGSVPHVMAGVKFETGGAFGGYEVKNQPVVVSHAPGEGAGRVVYTTFHNDEQADDVMQKILNFLVFVL